MKEQYIRQVKKELHLPRREKREVLRDLEEIFSSAAEHGETQRQVMERLGTPKEFAGSAAAQFGADSAAPCTGKERWVCIAAFFIAAACFLFAAAQMGGAPPGAIGQADAMTNIRIEGAFALPAFPIMPAAGILAAASAAVGLARLARKNRREE